MPPYRNLKAWEHATRLAVACVKASETILGIANELGYIPPADYARVDAQACETSRTLYGLLRKIGTAAASGHKGERTQARS